MNPRTTAILFVLALALGSFVWFYEIEGEEGRQESEARQQRLFPDVEAGAVEWIELRTSDERDVRIERRAEGWELVEPLLFPADSFAVDGVASALAELASESVYEQPQAPAAYGLDDAAEIRFNAAGAEHGLRTGDATPLGSNSYASVSGESAVYTVASTGVNAVRKSFDDLRDKRILAFDAETVQRFSASWPDGRVTLARDGGEWRLESPLEAEADADTARDLLSSLSFLRADSFADQPPPDDQSGLDAPAFAVTLELVAGGTAEDVGGQGAESASGAPRVLELRIGSAEADGSRYVRAGRPTLYMIPAQRLDDLPRTVSAYRFKQLASFQSNAARRLELVYHAVGDGASEAVTITAIAGDTGWSSSPESIEPDKLRRLVEELSRLEASDVLAEEMGPDELLELGLEPPKLLLAVYGEEPEGGEAPLLAQLRLGVLRGSDGVVAQRVDRPTVFSIGYEATEHIPVSLEALRNHFLAGPDAAEGVIEAERPVVDPEALELQFDDLL